MFDNLNEKEKRILESATNIFAQKGFHKTSTSEIAKAAKVAEGTIFRYFKTKKDILRNIMIQLINTLSGKFVFESIENIIENSEDKELKVILKEIILDRYKLANKIYPMARVVFAESLFHEELRVAIYENIIKRVIEVYAVFHRKMQEKGKIRQEVDSDIAIRSIIANIVIFIAQRKLYRDMFEFKDEDLEKDMDQLIDIIIRGIAP
jgi:AcrR family transcriptional regulator